MIGYLVGSLHPHAVIWFWQEQGLQEMVQEQFPCVVVASPPPGAIQTVPPPLEPPPAPLLELESIVT